MLTGQGWHIFGKTGFRQGSGNNPVFTGKSGICREICGNDSIIYITTG